MDVGNEILPNKPSIKHLKKDSKIDKEIEVLKEQANLYNELNEDLDDDIVDENQ